MHHLTLSGGVKKTGMSHILLDNQSSVHIFHNKTLLNQFVKSETTLHLGGVVKGHVLKTDIQGSFLDIAKENVWYSTDSVANILSFRQLEEDGHSPTYDRVRKAFIVPTPMDGVLEFSWDANVEHYVCDFAKHQALRVTLMTKASDVLTTVLTTIASNEAQYPKRLVKAARRARDLQARLGFLSTGKLAELINSGNLTNESVSVQDAERALAILGPDIASLKGKTQKRQPTQLPIETPRQVVRGPLVLHLDIIFVRAVPYLLSVTTPLGYIMIDVLSHSAKPLSYDKMDSFVRSASAIRRSLLMMLNRYRSRHFAVNTILTDNEGGVNQMESELSTMGITVNACGPGQHIALVEHKAKLVKQRRRCHIHHVPFALPFLMEMFLVYHCVYTLNCMPTSTRGDHVAPKVDFLGRKLDSARDLRFVWGDLCQAHNPDNIITNSDKARTDACVLLLSTGNLNGSVKMLNLASWRVVTRDQWTVTPYDETTIQMITARALKDEVSLTTKQREAYRAKDAVFRRVYQPLSDRLDFEEPAAMVMPTESPPVLHQEAVVESPEEETQGRASPVTNHDQSVDEPTADQRGVIASHEPTTLSRVPAKPTPSSNTPTSSTVPVQTPAEHAPPVVQPTTTAAPPVQEAAKQPTPTAVSTPKVPQQHSYNLRPRKNPRITQTLAAGHPARTISFATRARFFNRSKRVYALAAQKKDIISHITPRQALKKQHLRDAAIKSMISELKGLLDKGCFEGIHRKTLTHCQCKKIIQSSMFLKEKYKANGEFEKLKARLVAGGHMQDRADMGDVSSPVVSTTSVYMLATIAAKERRAVTCVDIASAFLNSDMSGEDVLMKLDADMAKMICSIDINFKQFLEPDGTLIVRLNKALYGCVKSSFLWYQTLTSFLMECGYAQNPYDPCVYNLSQDGVQCTVCFHVDDLMITCVDKNIIDQLVSKMTARFGSITAHEGKHHNYLGALFDFSEEGMVHVSMPHMTQQLIEDSGITGTAATPAATNLFDIDNDSPLLNDDEKKYFHSFVHRVMYLANRINGECLVACAFLSSRVQSPTIQDHGKLQRLLKYLAANPNLRLTLQASDKLEVMQYTDASYGVHADGKSHTGSSITLGKGAVHARSVKQRIVTKSSTEAEMVGLSDEASRGLWCNLFLEQQGYKLPPLKQLQDNQSTICLGTKGSATAARTRHINIRYFWITDYVERGEMCLEYMPTGDMIADGLTKPLQGEEFLRMRRLLLNSLPDVLDDEAIHVAAVD